MFFDYLFKIRNDKKYLNKMSKKLSKSYSVRIIRNKNNDNYFNNNKSERRQSFSCDDDVNTSNVLNKTFLKTLNKWKLRENNVKKQSNIEKRKSQSLSDINLMRQEEQFDINSYLSDSNLPTVKNINSVTTETFNKAEFRSRLENALSRGPYSKVHVQVKTPDEDESESEVQIRPSSSQAFRYDTTPRTQSCFLYSGRAKSPSKKQVVREGRFEKVKIGTKAGKRALPRNWHHQKYGVITSEGCLFLSDEKINVYNLYPPPAIVDSIDISGARVVRGSAHTTKKNVIELTTADGRILLLQNDEGNNTEAWLQDFIKVAGPQKAGSLPRSKSMRIEDPPPTQSGGVQDTSVKHALGRFFGKRPTRETLEDKGIYKCEPVFGNNLEALCDHTSSGLEAPLFVKECIKVLGTQPHISQVGLYRTSGNLSHVQRLRYRVDQGQIEAVSEERDTDVLAGALKMFFRELRHPLIEYKHYIKLVSEIEKNVAPIIIRKHLKSLLLPSHYTTLKALIEHLAEVCKFDKDNQMNAQSMAICWGPSLTWQEDESPDAMLQCTRVNKLIEYLIINSESLFLTQG